MELTEQQYVVAMLRHFGLSEAVRLDASYEALRAELARALNAWGARPANELEVAWTFPDRLIAYTWAREGDVVYDRNRERTWEIPWQRGEDEAIIFGQPVAVQPVTTYEPVTESAPQRKGGQRLQETVEQTLTVAESKGDGELRRIKAVGITADVINANGRRYPRKVLAEAVARLNGHLHESNGQGNLIATGEAEHPSDKGQRVNILETVVKWQAASLDAPGRVLLEGVILPTAKGRDVQVLVEAGVPIGVSMRGYGSSRAVQLDGETVQEVTELTIRGFDLVAQPSDPNGAITEAQTDGEAVSVQEAQNVTEEERKALEEAKKEAERQLQEAQKALADQAKALEEAQKAATELAERKAREAVETAITEATKDLKYGEALNGAFVQAVKAAKPQTPEAVKALVEAKRVEYDAIAAAAKLGGMGKAGTGVEVKGPVFERETGQPEYTRAAWEITESLAKAGEGRHMGSDKAQSPAGIYAARVLERFDKQHQQKLAAEARAFEEAAQTSDLNLPYSVARMVIEQAYPELVAANVYDFGVTDMAPAQIYYESYVGETGAAPAVVNEAVAASTTAWFGVANKRLQPGTVSVTHTSGTPTYVEGTDYVVDYEEGKFWVLATITNGQSLKISYTYDAFRKGEMVEIERAKNQLTSAQLPIAADRLAMQISNEAIVFSRSQLGYDAVTRTLSNLARLVRRTIDRGVLYKGLAASLKQANNSGGTWASGSDALDLFVKYLGVAKVKVYNRFYVPTAIVMSVTNADRLSNWDGFKTTGFTNAQLSAAGFVGQVKGLPTFASPEYPDTYAQVVHRELIAHRIYQPMVFKGPFPSYNNGKLQGADQYYAEEFNGSMITVEQKTAHIKIS